MSIFIHPRLLSIYLWWTIPESNQVQTLMRGPLDLRANDPYIPLSGYAAGSFQAFRGPAPFGLVPPPASRGEEQRIEQQESIPASVPFQN